MKIRKHPRNREIMNSESRQLAGVTVSFSTDRGDRMTVCEQGGNLAWCVQRCITRMERRADDGPWFIDAISTPSTIYSDLSETNTGTAMFRERQILSRLGRLDLLRVPLVDPNRGTSGKKTGHMWRKLYSRGPLGGWNP